MTPALLAAATALLSGCGAPGVPLETACEQVRELVAQIPASSLREADYHRFGSRLEALGRVESPDGQAAVERLIEVSAGFSDADGVDSVIDWNGQLADLSDLCVRAGTEPLLRPGL